MIFDSREEFQGWLDHMEEALDVWLDRLPEAVRDKLDFSIDSLDALEGWLLDRYPSIDAALAEPDPLILDGAARYIGETFRKLFGGVWKQDPTRKLWGGHPYITDFRNERLVLSPSPHGMATSSISRRRGNRLSSLFRKDKAALESEPPGEHTNDSRQQGSAAGAMGCASPLTDSSPDDSDRVKDTYASFIMFHRPGFTLEDAADALAASSLTVESLGDHLSVHWDPDETPVLRVYLSRGPDVQEEAAEIGEGTPYADAVARCDARFEICFDDLDEVLDNINTLIEAQATLHWAIQEGFMFNTWNCELVALEPIPPQERPPFVPSPRP